MKKVLVAAIKKARARKKVLAAKVAAAVTKKVRARKMVKALAVKAAAVATRTVKVLVAKRKMLKVPVVKDLAAVLSKTDVTTVVHQSPRIARAFLWMKSREKSGEELFGSV